MAQATKQQLDAMAVADLLRPTLLRLGNELRREKIAGVSPQQVGLLVAIKYRPGVTVARATSTRCARGRRRDAAGHGRAAGAVRWHLSVRRAEAVRAEAIVEDEIQAFAGWLGRLEVLPTLTALRSLGDRSSTVCWPRTRAAGSRCPSAIASGSRRSRERS